MFHFFTSNYWQSKASPPIATQAVEAVTAISHFTSAGCNGYDITAASVVEAVATQAVEAKTAIYDLLGIEYEYDDNDDDDITATSVTSAVATQAAQAISTTANFAVAATGSLLELAWGGLVSYGPPLAQGVWNGIATYGPPLAQGAWTGLTTYGPPAADALAKGTVWAGANAWEAAKWSGSALSTAAQEYHVKEHALHVGQEVLSGAAKGLIGLAGKTVEVGLPALTYLKDQAVETGKSLLAEARDGWDLLYGKGIDLGPLDIWAADGARPEDQAFDAQALAPAPVREHSLEFDGSGVLSFAPITASVNAVVVDDCAKAINAVAHGLDQENSWQTAQGHASQGAEVNQDIPHCELLICLIGVF